MSDLLGDRGVDLTVAALASPVTVVAASTLARDVEAVMHAGEHLRCVAVRGTTAVQQVGLLSRARLQDQLSGRLGYGRVLHADKPVGALTDWSPVVVRASTPISELARRVLEDQGTHPVTDVLVTAPNAPLRHVDVIDVFRALSSQLATRALTDSLTGLANRDHFMQHLQRCCSDPDPRKRLALLYVDLDGFKAVNDGHGHGVGDQVLQVTADRLRGCCGSGDLAARLGGDEFAMIVQLPADAAVGTAAQQLGERVRTCLSGTISVSSLVLPGRASIGLAVASSVLADAETLLREADLTMYQAKSAGGGRLHVVTDVGGTAVIDSFNPDRRELQEAIDERQFLVHYQPIVDAASGRLASVEALVRWQHPERGLLAPGTFLSAATDAGLAPDLDLHVLQVALAQFSQWRRDLADAAPPSINVNVSVQGLLHPDMAQAVIAALSSSGVNPALLRLELPETATLSHLDAARASLDVLRAASVRLTLDDMGAGASTLHHLTDLTLDGVKIDRRFVASMDEDERDAAVVRMLVELGLNTGLAVTAEGVETEAQLRSLQAMAHGRSVFVQGYLVSRPVPAEQLLLPWPDGTYRRSSAVSSRRAVATG